MARIRARLRAEGRQVLEWSESNPRRVLPLEGFEAGWEKIGALLAHPGGAGYEPDPRGLFAAREALAAHSALHPDRYFLCASTSEAYGWLFKLLCEPGEAVLVPKPGYPLFDFLAGLEGVEARSWRLEYFHPGGWRIDFDSIEAALARGGVKALVLINPNNPTGSYIGEDERALLLEIASRAGVALIVDEVFFGFPVEGRAGIRSFVGEPAVLTFVLDGLSKGLGLPQLKLGWIAASGPAAILDEALARLELLADTYLSAATPVMRALPELLALGPSYRKALGTRLSRNLGTLRARLEGPGSPHRVYRCEGGWTALVESPRYAPEEALASALLEEAGLASQPGHFFDMEREALFTAGLILPEAVFAEGAGRYAAWFDAAGNKASNRPDT